MMETKKVEYFDKQNEELYSTLDNIKVHYKNLWFDIFQNKLDS